MDSSNINHNNHTVSIILLCFVIACITIFPYVQMLDHSFVNFDDPEYVFDNYYIKKGLTAEGIKWAFNFSNIAYWHPLTWMSHMLDVSLYGMNAGYHLVTNMILHI